MANENGAFVIDRRSVATFEFGAFSRQKAALDCFFLFQSLIQIHLVALNSFKLGNQRRFKPFQ